MHAAKEIRACWLQPNSWRGFELRYVSFGHAIEGMANGPFTSKFIFYLLATCRGRGVNALFLIILYTLFRVCRLADTDVLMS